VACFKWQRKFTY